MGLVKVGATIAAMATAAVGSIGTAATATAGLVTSAATSMGSSAVALAGAAATTTAGAAALVAGGVTLAAGAGVGAGLAFNEVWEYGAGNPLGVSIYNATHDMESPTNQQAAFAPTTRMDIDKNMPDVDPGDVENSKKSVDIGESMLNISQETLNEIKKQTGLLGSARPKSGDNKKSPPTLGSTNNNMVAFQHVRR